MNILKLKSALRESKKEAGLKYSILHPDRYGDCNSCVGATLCEKYGDDSKGIYVKHWDTGVNKSFRELCDIEEIYIAHDITEEQFKIIKAVFERYGFVVKNNEYNEYESIVVRQDIYIARRSVASPCKYGYRSQYINIIVERW